MKGHESYLLIFVIDTLVDFLLEVKLNELELEAGEEFREDLSEPDLFGLDLTVGEDSLDDVDHFSVEGFVEVLADDGDESATCDFGDSWL